MRIQDEDFDSGEDMYFFVEAGLLVEIFMKVSGLFFKNLESVVGSSEVVVSG